MNIISIILAVWFFVMCGYSLYMNNDWAKTVSKMNNSWAELAKKQNEEWLNKCLALAGECGECDRLKKELDEIKHEQAKRNKKIRIQWGDANERT